MSTPNIRRALISVYDKSGVVDFARALADEFAVEIISTGGTASLLVESGIPVTLVDEVTGFPEMMNGRVKTLHPKIHAAILADRDNPDHMQQLEQQGIRPIDMVVVNLYPFEKTIADPNCTFEQAIEMIDIGGPCMLRAAAKNHKHVVVCCGSSDYDAVLETLRTPTDDKTLATQMRERASRVFAATNTYDARINAWLESQSTAAQRFAETSLLGLSAPKILRYGENPHMPGAAYDRDGGESTCESSVASARPVGNSSVDLSYNNYVDGDAALELCKELTRSNPSKPVSVFIKHTNACGVGVSADPVDAYRQAYLGDPNAAMGGILACNFEIETDFATTVMETYDRFGKSAGAGGFFLEVWIADSFSDDAVKAIHAAKKWGSRVRMLAVGDMTAPPEQQGFQYKSITGGMLVQARDLAGLDEDQWKVVTKRQPTEKELDDLRLAWLVCKHTKSNAITICKDNMLIGNGAGQMSRVMSCRIATWLAKENGHADQIAGAVAASDAFFPFSDGPEFLMDAGVTAIIQPGGSKRDEDTIAACNKHDVAMIMTGTRHFKH